MASHSAQPVVGVTSRRQLREASRPASSHRRTAAPAPVADAQQEPRHRGAASWGVRSGVLVALAAVTVAVPLAQQQERSAAAVPDVQADATLPDTVDVLTSTTGSVVPPSSLLSTGAATVVRDEISVSRSEDRGLLPGCDGQAETDAANGELPESSLCTLWDGHTEIRADAAEALAQLNAVWVARFGTDLCLSSGYRTLAEQRAVKAKKGGLAAPAGRSNHGWGLAVDLCSSQTTGDQWEWLNQNAGVFGWENPSWAQPGGSGPYERWHWEYTRGVKAGGEYYG